MYKLVIEHISGYWYWELRQLNDFVMEIGNMEYSTKSNARRAFWRLFNEKTIKNIKEG